MENPLMGKYSAPKQTEQIKVIKAKFNEIFTAGLRIEEDVATLMGDRLSFIECAANGVHIQTGPGKTLAIDTMTEWKPFHIKTFFPLTLLPGIISMPLDIPMPPCAPIIPDMVKFAAVAAAMAPCWVAEELYGKNDIRTSYARLFCVVHDNFFIRVYCKHGKAWARFLKKNSWLKKFVEPIWNYMWVKGMDLSTKVIFLESRIK